VTVSQDSTTGKTTFSDVKTGKDLLDIISHVAESHLISLANTPLKVGVPLGPAASLTIEHEDNGESATLTFHFNT
jgi:hypothetical protein